MSDRSRSRTDDKVSSRHDSHKPRHRSSSRDRSSRTHHRDRSKDRGSRRSSERSSRSHDSHRSRHRSSSRERHSSSRHHRSRSRDRDHHDRHRHSRSHRDHKDKSDKKDKHSRSDRHDRYRDRSPRRHTSDSSSTKASSSSSQTPLPVNASTSSSIPGLPAPAFTRIRPVSDADRSNTRSVLVALLHRAITSSLAQANKDAYTAQQHPSHEHSDSDMGLSDPSVVFNSRISYAVAHSAWDRVSAAIEAGDEAILNSLQGQGEDTSAGLTSIETLVVGEASEHVRRVCLDSVSQYAQLLEHLDSTPVATFDDASSPAAREAAAEHGVCVDEIADVEAALGLRTVFSLMQLRAVPPEEVITTSTGDAEDNTLSDRISTLTHPGAPYMSLFMRSSFTPRLRAALTPALTKIHARVAKECGQAGAEALCEFRALSKGWLEERQGQDAEVCGPALPGTVEVAGAGAGGEDDDDDDAFGPTPAEMLTEEQRERLAQVQQLRAKQLSLAAFEAQNKHMIASGGGADDRDTWMTDILAGGTGKMDGLQAAARRGFSNVTHRADEGSKAAWTSVGGAAAAAAASSIPASTSASASASAASFASAMIPAAMIPAAMIPAAMIPAAMIPAAEHMNAALALFPCRPELKNTHADADILTEPTPAAEDGEDGAGVGEESSVDVLKAEDGIVSDDTAVVGPVMPSAPTADDMRSRVLGNTVHTPAVLTPGICAAFIAEIGTLAVELEASNYFSYIVEKYTPTKADVSCSADSAVGGQGKVKTASLLEIYEQVQAETRGKQGRGNKDKELSDAQKAAEAKVPTTYGKFGRAVPTELFSFNAEELFKSGSKNMSAAKSSKNVAEQFAAELAARFGPGR